MDKISTLILTASQNTKKVATTIAKATKSKKKSDSLSQAFEPSDAVIDRILNYSKALSVKPSKSMGYVENLLN
jgi:hypothetical protein